MCDPNHFKGCEAQRNENVPNKKQACHLSHDTSSRDLQVVLHTDFGCFLPVIVGTT